MQARSSRGVVWVVIAGSAASAAVLFLVGLFAWTSTPAAPPPVEIVHVIASTPGMEVEDADRRIALPLFEALRGTRGITHVRSEARADAVVLRLSIAPGTARDAVMGALRERLEDSALPEPPILRFGDERAPVRWVTAPLERSTVLETVVRQRLEVVSGVGAVRVCGVRREAMEVRLDDARLSAFDLRASDVVRAITTSSPQLPSGQLVAQVPAPIGGVDTLAEHVIAERAGAPVRLRDVADVVRGVRVPECTALRDGQPVVSLAVVLQHGVTDPAPVLAELDARLAALATEHALTTLPSEGMTFGRVRALGTRDDRLRLASALESRVQGALVELDGEGLRIVAPVPEAALVTAVNEVPGLAYEGDVIAVVRGELEAARAVARALRDAWARAGHAAVVREDEPRPETRVVLDRARAAELGVTPSDVAQSVRLASDEGLEVATSVEGELELPVVVRMGADLERAGVTSRSGTIPLTAVARLEQSSTPTRLVRHDGAPSVEVAAAGEGARDAFERIARELRLPAGISVALAPE